MSSLEAEKIALLYRKLLRAADENAECALVRSEDSDEFSALKRRNSAQAALACVQAALTISRQQGPRR